MLPYLAKEIETVEQKAPLLVSPLAKALCRMAKVDLKSGGGFGVAFLATWPARESRLQESALDRDYEPEQVPGSRTRAPAMSY